MSRLTRDGTAEPVSRDQILRHARGQGNVHLPCSADHEQDWQPYPVDPYSAICDDHTYIHTYHGCTINSATGVVETINRLVEAGALHYSVLCTYSIQAVIKVQHRSKQLEIRRFCRN